MKPWVRRTLIILGGIFLGFAAAMALWGQEMRPPQTPPPQEPAFRNPAVGPEHRRLAFLLGYWEEDVDYAGAGAGQGGGSWFARPQLGLFLMIDYQGRGPGGPYRAHGLLTWDREARDYRMLWFDDAGGIGDYRGNFTDDHTLVVEHRGKVEGRAFRERLTYRRVSATEVRTRIEQAWDSEDYKPYLDAVATRMGDRPPQPQPGKQPRPPQ